MTDGIFGIMEVSGAGRARGGVGRNWLWDGGRREKIWHGSQADRGGASYVLAGRFLLT